MTSEPDAIAAGLRHAIDALRGANVRFALAGGLAVAVRGEPRFTADVDLVDLVVAVANDRAMEALVFQLRDAGFRVVALVEHEARGRLSTARLASPLGPVIDLIAATCGIEAEIVERATDVVIPGIGPLAVARAEELLAMKVLSMTDRRPQDRMDAIGIVLVTADQLDLDVVVDNLGRITDRGYHRDQDLVRKLDDALAAARGG